MAEARQTALYAEHRNLGAAFTDFGGWQMPLKYSRELAEHHAVRRAVGLFDLSHMGEISVSGPDAAAFLDYALVGRLSAVAVGRARYSLICTPDGGIMDDLISYRLAGDHFLVVPNAGNTTAVAAALTERASAFDVAVQDQSTATSLIAVQGPAAEPVLRTLVPESEHDTVHNLKYYAAARMDIAGLNVLLARTGYTGEDGFEIFLPSQDAATLWRRLLAAGAEYNLQPAGLACRDSLRLEAGMPLYGHELTLQTDPFSAGLGGAVAFNKGDFVGREALAARRTQHDAGAGQVLVGLQGTGRRAAREGYPVLSGEVTVGQVTSGALSPTLGYPIALAYVDQAHATPGTRVDVDVRGTAVPFTVVKHPFYRREAASSSH